MTYLTCYSLLNAAMPQTSKFPIKFLSSNTLELVKIWILFDNLRYAGCFLKGIIYPACCFREVIFTTDDSTFDWDLQDLIYTDEIFEISDNF